MSTFENYLEAVQTNTRESFAGKHPSPFLLLELGPDVDDLRDWVFQTITLTNQGLGAPGDDGPALSKESERFRVFPVVNIAGDPWQERITVGRATNADIVLPHQSVSKLHAHFSGRKGSMAVTDMDSRNGTRINGVKVSPGSTSPVGPGDTVRFGALSLQVLAPEELYDLVRSHLRPAAV